MNGNFDVNAFLSSLSENERRRLRSAVRIMAEWILSRKTREGNSPHTNQATSSVKGHVGILPQSR
jgi:hypothetical protein